MAENNQPEAPQEPQKASGVVAFLEKLRKKVVHEDETPSDKKASAISKGISKQGPLYAHFLEFNWSKQQSVWLKLSLLAHAALLLLILGGVFLAYTRPTYIQIGAPTLSESARNFYELTPTVQDISYDHMAYFVISALEQLNKLDTYGNPYRSLLQGQVAPDILKKADLRYTNNIARIRQQKLIQNLIIQRVLPPIVNEGNNTLAIFVEGYYAIMLEANSGDPINRITPYRSKVILEITPVSKLNPFPFYLQDIREVVGEDAVRQWDKENRYLFK